MARSGGIHDARKGNDGISKADHPPAKQPRHRSLARWHFWWDARHPGVPQVCAKRDVNRAFKWHAIDPHDTGDFGTRLPGKPVGVPGDILVVLSLIHI